MVEKLGQQLIPQMVKEGLLSACADPGFQVQLLEAQKAAASTERPDDYVLLSQLLIARAKHGQERKTRAGIQRAVQIIDLLDDDALLGITAFYAVDTLSPADGKSIANGIRVLSELFSKLLYGQLPDGQAWIDHLDLLGALRITGFGNIVTLKKLDVYLSERFDGYVLPGIDVLSDSYQTAKDILRNASLDLDLCFVAHEYCDNHVRIPVTRKHDLDKFTIHHTIMKDGTTNQIIQPLSVDQHEALKQVYGLYDTQPASINSSKEGFFRAFNEHKSLRILREWWDKIPIAFNCTSVGMAIAHANAQRCAPNVPSIY
jgi:hypothetical protein